MFWVLKLQVSAHSMYAVTQVVRIIQSAQLRATTSQVYKQANSRVMALLGATTMMVRARKTAQRQYISTRGVCAIIAPQTPHLKLKILHAVGAFFVVLHYRAVSDNS